MNTLTIHGKVYEVVIDNTPETHDQEGRHNLAAEMRRNHATHDYCVKLPKGQRGYMVVEFESGSLSRLRPIPGLRF